MQHLEGSGMPVLYIGRMVLKGYRKSTPTPLFLHCAFVTCFRLKFTLPSLDTGFEMGQRPAKRANRLRNLQRRVVHN